MTKIITTTATLLAKTSAKLSKASPKIYLGLGIVALGTAGYFAAKASYKLKQELDIMDQRKEDIIESCETPEEAKKALAKQYIHNICTISKMYAPAVILAVGGTLSIFHSHNILMKNNLAIIAAAKAVESQFASYRGRVKEEYGEEVERNIYRGIKSEEVEEVRVSEDGTSTVEKVRRTNKDENFKSVYAKFFDDSNVNWASTPEESLIFLRAQETYYNHILLARGFVLLNDVYDGLGIKRTKIGAVSGWSLTNPNGDKFIDFGLYDENHAPTRAFINGEVDSVMIDPNVQGFILDQIDF